MTESLTQLFNRSIALGKVPSQWKMANISAIFKGKGDDQDPMNFRPISVTSCLGKILEKNIFKYLHILNEEEMCTLEGEISEKECEIAIKSMKLNKSL